MANCKDCLHVDVCEEYGEVFSLIKGGKCSLFKDHSRFAELPCKLGDEIFCTIVGRIYQGIVGRIELDDEGFNIITTDGYCFNSLICYHTQEEAEKVMNVKERENNV